ncbi:MAG: cation diffusion facilitator family transporter [Planctomycetes bacterium]|nr:cation diffusion facilitator family transporter [Planctomycetota bacterium]MCC8116772.1 cation diffusion facilitator family transporter [Planctomycetota bacterium]
MSATDTSRPADTVHFSRYERASGTAVRDISRVTWVGVVVNLFLAVVKGVAGYLSRSNALTADAVHTVSDLATDCAILVGVRYWSAPADAEHPHGHQKIETLVTMVIGVLLAAVGLGMGYNAVAALAAASSGVVPAAATAADAVTLAATAVAFVSILSKEILYRWTAAKGVQYGSSALVANAWHHRSDALSSIPPLLTLGGAALGARLGYNLWFLDPVGTVIVCVMLLQAAWEVMHPTLGALLDASADRRLCSDIRKTVLATDGVIDAHRIRTRVICSNAVAVDLHITVDKDLTVEKGHAIASDVQDRILALGVNAESATRPVDVMVHVEPGDPMDKRLPGHTSHNTKVDWLPKDETGKVVTERHASPTAWQSRAKG